jgi:antitoxin MazE
MSKTATITVQKRGNSLAIRIPAALARKVNFVAGQSVEVTTDDLGVVVHRKGTPPLTLSAKVGCIRPG